MHILEWAHNHHTNVYAYDYKGRAFERSAEFDPCYTKLVFIVHNNHLYEMPNDNSEMCTIRANKVQVSSSPTVLDIKFAVDDFATLH
jgi:hypothetical protein